MPTAAAARAFQPQPHFRCTTAHHSLIRSNPTSFDRETKLIGYMSDGAGGFLRLANCRMCGSTLALTVGAARVGL